MKISSVAQMRELDRKASSLFGITELILMENAGDAAFAVIARMCEVQSKKFVVICGSGNNGGDGFVVARKICSHGGIVNVVICGDMKGYRGAARQNLDVLLRLPVRIYEMTRSKSILLLLQESDVVIDAMFGTGLTREVQSRHRHIINMMNNSKKTIISLDIPSGVNGDSGAVMGTAVCAHATVTFGLPKWGNILFPGYDLCGRLYVSHISFPPVLYQDNSLEVSINEPPPLPRRKRDAHKNSCGDVLFIAGAAGYFGAPYLAAYSFLKAGGGYSRLAAPKSIVSFIAQKACEVVFMPLMETESGSISATNEKTLIELSSKCDMVVLGPGLSLNEETQGLVRRLITRIDKPLIIDGDGITAVVPALASLKKRRAPTILTPHLGEMSRITGRHADQIVRERIPILQETAQKLNSIIVLKGAHTLIAYPDSTVRVNMSGNAGMATAGTGDVLTGTIAAMFGLGLSIDDAVAKGVFIHGLSGDLAALDIGEDGITAHDVLEYLPEAVAEDRAGICGYPALSARYGIEQV